MNIRMIHNGRDRDSLMMPMDDRTVDLMLQYSIQLIRCDRRPTLTRTTVLVNNYSSYGGCNVSTEEGAFRYCEFWRSRRGHTWGAAAAVVPCAVNASPSAGNAVIVPRR